MLSVMALGDPMLGRDEESKKGVEMNNVQSERDLTEMTLRDDEILTPQEIHDARFRRTLFEFLVPYWGDRSMHERFKANRKAAIENDDRLAFEKNDKTEEGTMYLSKYGMFTTATVATLTIIEYLYSIL